MGRDLLRFRSLSRALIGLGAFTLLTLPLLAPADTRTVLVDSDNPNTTPSVTVHARPAMNVAPIRGPASRGLDGATPCRSRAMGAVSGANGGRDPGLEAWPSDPSVNLPVSTANRDQYLVAAIPDGAGGMIMVWQDDRDSVVSAFDVYAHHVLGSGMVDPAWPVNGVALSKADGDQILPVIASDGSGGALVAWQDSRSGLSDIYAQHLLSSGIVDPDWTGDGLLVCDAANNQRQPKITADGAHGVYVTWDDMRTGSRRVFVQHVLTSGVDQTWAANGVRVCTNEAFQSWPVICSDGAGGAIVAWHDGRSVGTDIYAQRVSAGGVLQWAASGAPVCTATGSQTLNGAKSGFVFVFTTSADTQSNAIIPDGAGGCIVTWRDDRTSASTGLDVYAQHMLATGSVDGSWTASGVPLCTASGDQIGPSLILDGAGGAIATWLDARTGVYAQHVTSAGVVDGPLNGLALTMIGSQDLNTSGPPHSVRDGAGGAILFWSDSRDAATRGTDIYAQHVRTSPSFGIFPHWPADGTPVSIASGYQSEYGSVVSDGTGGAVACWSDGRNVGANGSDIYAQGGVLVASAPGAENPSLGYALSQIEPNPIRFDTAIRFNLLERSSVALVVDDVAGREVKSLVSGEEEAGTHWVKWSGEDRNGKRVLNGIYFAHMTASSVKDGSHFAATRKMIVLR